MQNSLQIPESDAHNFVPEKCLVPSLELQIAWEDKTKPTPDRFVEFIDVKGTIRPNALTLQYEPGISYPQETTETSGNGNKSVQCAL